MANIIQTFPTGAGGGSDIQVTSLPTASASELGKIYQYVGADTSSLTNGFFYECIEDSSTSPSTYGWAVKNVDEDETVEISKANFDLLTPAEKNNGKAYFIPDMDVVTNYTVMGNRFDKANIYTEDERMVGSWMGKPLYQKVIDCGDIPSGSQSGYAMYTFEEGISDARLINACCYDANGLNQSLSYINPSTSNTEIGFQMIRNSTSGRYQLMLRTNSDRSSFGKVLAIVQYTKTSDATVNIGTGNDYSTDEQIIGSWIDGKPLYQKTINEVISTYTDNSSRRTFRTSDVVLNPDYFVLCDWCLGSTKSGTTAFISGCGMTTTATIRRSVEMYTDNNNAKLQAHTLVSDAFTSATIIATIQYTKTTD